MLLEHLELSLPGHFAGHAARSHVRWLLHTADVTGSALPEPGLASASVPLYVVFPRPTVIAVCLPYPLIAAGNFLADQPEFVIPPNAVLSVLDDVVVDHTLDYNSIVLLSTQLNHWKERYFFGSNPLVQYVLVLIIPVAC